jgi:glycosyltransferase involved in cell wall biosynthesis
MAAPRSRTRVIYGGVDCQRYTPTGSGRRRGVLFIGRLTPHKGIDRLIRALPPGASLTIAGSTGHDQTPPEQHYPELLQRLAKDRDVHFLGAVPDADLPALLREAAVLALPSVHWTCYGRYVPVSELLGLVVLEAMASGTPVVCSRIGGLPEIVEEGRTGFLVEPGDVGELRDRLAQVLGDAPRALRMGREARDRALERFTWRHCAERCLMAYDELAGGGRSQATSPR